MNQQDVTVSSHESGAIIVPHTEKLSMDQIMESIRQEFGEGMYNEIRLSFQIMVINWIIAKAVTSLQQNERYETAMLKAFEEVKTLIETEFREQQRYIH